MENNKEIRLFDEFPPIPAEQWEAVVTADLKGADYERKLVWKTQEGFSVRPYYRAEDLEGIGFLNTAPGAFPFIRGVRDDNRWLVHQTIRVEDPKAANAQAVALLVKGVESLGFTLCNKDFSADDLEALLKGIALKNTEVTFGGCAAACAAGLLPAYLKAQGYGTKDVRAHFLIDPVLYKITLGGQVCEKGECGCFRKIAALVKDAGEFKRLRFVGVAGETFQNCGSTLVQELAFTLAAGHEYVVKLMEEGLSVDEAARTIRFSMAVSANYFMEIAKFRAARMLWANIIAPYNPSCGCAPKMKVHAVTSEWNMTVYDPYVNMLRGTTEAMSAAIAGVHSIEVLPFDAAYEKPTGFSARIARNTQLLLKEESHFDLVTDAAGGSYYLENLTRSIADAAWELFKRVEEKGGYIAAFKEGFIQAEIEAAADRKNKNIATRRQTLLGTNQYPNFEEVAGQEITESVITPDGCSCGCHEKDTCNCGPDCDCGCRDGEPCTCGCDGGCTCGCKEGATCTCECDDGCTCGCGPDCRCGNGECGPDCKCKGIKCLKPYRGAMPFERMRLRTDRSGKQPRAFMLTVGSLAFARARAQFSCNFFACAGIRVQDNTYFRSVIEGVEAALKSKAEIVVICASDDDYAALAPEAFRLLGGQVIFAVAGDPACRPDLEAAGIGNFINVKSNVLETLQNYLTKLGIES